MAHSTPQFGRSGRANVDELGASTGNRTLTDAAEAKGTGSSRSLNDLFAGAAARSLEVSTLRDGGDEADEGDSQLVTEGCSATTAPPSPTPSSRSGVAAPPAPLLSTPMQHPLSQRHLLADHSEASEPPVDSSLQCAASRLSSNGDQSLLVEKLTQQVQSKEQEIAQLRALFQTFCSTTAARESEKAAEIDLLRERMAKCENILQEPRSGLLSHRAVAGPGPLSAPHVGAGSGAGSGGGSSLEKSVLAHREPLSSPIVSSRLSIGALGAAVQASSKPSSPHKSYGSFLGQPCIGASIGASPLLRTTANAVNTGAVGAIGTVNAVGPASPVVSGRAIAGDIVARATASYRGPITTPRNSLRDQSVRPTVTSVRAATSCEPPVVRKSIAVTTTGTPIGTPRRMVVQTSGGAAPKHSSMRSLSPTGRSIASVPTVLRAGYRGSATFSQSSSRSTLAACPSAGYATKASSVQVMPQTMQQSAAPNWSGGQSPPSWGKPGGVAAAALQPPRATASLVLPRSADGTVGLAVVPGMCAVNRVTV